MRRREGFTLTELLVLMPVAALLGTMLFASLDDAKERLQASQCLNNMRQWGLAIGMYCNEYNDHMPYEGTSSGIDTGFNLGAWFNVLPQYVNQSPFKDLYTSSPSNIPLPGARSIYVCPSLTVPGSDWRPATVNNPWFGYAMNSVLQGVLPSPPGEGLYKRSKAALPAQVILFSESENNSFPFCDGYFIGPNHPLPATPPRHSGGMNFVFVDGHAQWYSMADYGRPTPLTVADAAQIEWSAQRKIYWFPCSKCNKM